MGGLIMDLEECVFYDDGHCEYHGDDCEDHLTCNGIEEEED